MASEFAKVKYANVRYSNGCYFVGTTRQYSLMRLKLLGAWNQKDPGLNPSAVICWPCGPGQVFNVSEPQFPHL